MELYEYVGCFFDYIELSEKVRSIRKNPLPCEKPKPHVTFVYGPSQVDTDLFGTEILATVVGYGNDGENEGVLVTLSCQDPRLTEMIEQIPCPHITLAVSQTGQAVNTRYLEFQPVEPVEIWGRYSGHIDI